MTEDVKIAVYVDGSAWNALFVAEVDLANAFPSERYSLFVTREVEIELDAIPPKGKGGDDKRALKTYIADNIAKHNVRTTSVFGFASVEPDGSLSPIQVYGGFGQGTWQSEADRDWYGSKDVKSLVNDKGRRPTGLAANQADASLAVRSFNSIVLTDERKRKKGPLRLAASQGGYIVYLADVRESGLALKEYIAKMKASPRP